MSLWTEKWKKLAKVLPFQCNFSVNRPAGLMSHAKIDSPTQKTCIFRFDRPCKIRKWILNFLHNRTISVTYARKPYGLFRSQSPFGSCERLIENRLLFLRGHTKIQLRLKKLFYQACNRHTPRN